MTGADRYRFVNGLCTNKVLDAKPGQVIESCFTTKTGRTVDLTTVVVLDDALLVLCSASRLQHLFQAMDALIFPKDAVQIEDLTLALARFHLVGPKASALVGTAPDGLPAALPGAHEAAAWGSTGLLVSGSGLASPGYTVVVPMRDAVAAWQHLASRVSEVGV